MKRGRKFSGLLLILVFSMLLTALMPMTILFAAGDDDDANTGEDKDYGDAGTVKETRKMVYW